MTPSLLPEEMYDLDFFDGWDFEDKPNEVPVLRITADTPKRPGGITTAFASGLEKATAYTVQELSKVSLGVAIHFTPPNGKTVTPLRTSTGSKGVKALKRRIATEIMPAVFTGDNATGMVPSAIPGGDPSNPTPVKYRLGAMEVPEGVIPRGVGGWSFVQPRGKIKPGTKIKFTDPLQMVRQHGYFTKARKSNNVRRYANKKWRMQPYWVRPGSVKAAAAELQKNAGRLISGWYPAARILGYGQRNKSDFHPNADGFANYYGTNAEDMGFTFGNREFKNLHVARIRKGLADRIMEWSERGWDNVLSYLERNYIKTLKASTGL
jgi:hypothetical protein